MFDSALHMHGCSSQGVLYLHAELGCGRQHDGARGVAQREAVAGAALLLAHALHQRQQVRQRLPAACTGMLTFSLDAPFRCHTSCGRGLVVR